MSGAVQACTSVVASNPSNPAAPQLPGTGADIALIVALMILTIGIGAALLLRTRHRRRASTASYGLAALAGLGVLTLTVGYTAPTPAAADQTSQCALISVDAIERNAAAANLVPGQRVDVLTFTTRNVTATPITIRVQLAPTAGQPEAFTAEITSNETTLTAASLSESPTSADVVLQPGERFRVAANVALADAFPGAGATAAFDAVITAAGQ